MYKATDMVTSGLLRWCNVLISHHKLSNQEARKYEILIKKKSTYYFSDAFILIIDHIFGKRSEIIKISKQMKRKYKLKTNDIESSR